NSSRSTPPRPAACTAGERPRWSVLPSTRFFRDTPPAGPVVFFRAQTLHYRIESNIPPFFLRLGLGAHAVIEEVILPLHPLDPSRTTLPVSDCNRHAVLARKGQRRMPMIRH